MWPFKNKVNCNKELDIKPTPLPTTLQRIIKLNDSGNFPSAATANFLSSNMRKEYVEEQKQKYINAAREAIISQIKLGRYNARVVITYYDDRWSSSQHLSVAEAIEIANEIDLNLRIKGYTVNVEDNQTIAEREAELERIRTRKKKSDGCAWMIGLSIKISWE
jgi:hypothetical protein